MENLDPGVKFAVCDTRCSKKREQYELVKGLEERRCLVCGDDKCKHHIVYLEPTALTGIKDYAKKRIWYFLCESCLRVCPNGKIVQLIVESVTGLNN